MKKQFCIYLFLVNFMDYTTGNIIEYDARFMKLYEYDFPDWLHEFLIITNTINIPRNICKKLNKYTEACYSYDSWANGV